MGCQIFKQRPIGNYCFLGKDIGGDIEYGLGQGAQARPQKVQRHAPLNQPPTFSSRDDKSQPTYPAFISQTDMSPPGYLF